MKKSRFVYRALLMVVAWPSLLLFGCGGGSGSDSGNASGLGSQSGSTSGLPRSSCSGTIAKGPDANGTFSVAVTPSAESSAVYSATLTAPIAGTVILVGSWNDAAKGWWLTGKDDNGADVAVVLLPGVGSQSSIPVQAVITIGDGGGSSCALQPSS
jgi:hypothetical protein